MAIEEPKYSVQAKKDGYEVRLYETVLVAETIVEEEFDDAGNKAFRILADYIFGNNSTQTEIAMTAPVTQSSNSEKIAMTAPVSQSKTEKGFLVQFTMPAKYNLQTVPKPKDNRVTLREIPAKRYAVYSYSGSWSQKRYQNKLTEFLQLLEKDQITTVGEPIFARYNSPFQLWFLRRNEIWLELQ